MKIGAITIGQAPRTDVTADIMDIFEGQAELIQAGGLDGLSREEIAAFQPEEGDYVLVSRLTDGTSVTFAERYILPRLQEAIDKMERGRLPADHVLLHREISQDINSQADSLDLSVRYPGSCWSL